MWPADSSRLYAGRAPVAAHAAHLVGPHEARLAALAMLAALVSACTESLGPLEQLPRELSVAEGELVSSSNRFGLELFAGLAADQRTENVFVSPLSAYMALGMATNGAAGETLAEMRATLGQAGLDEAEANDAFRGLIDLLLSLDPGVELAIANSIWYRLGLSVDPAFARLSEAVFDATVRGLDFDDAAAPGVINAWVEDATRGRIRDLVGQLRPEDVMYLINAVYFKGRWQLEFDPDDTRDLDFTLLDGTDVRVAVMRRNVELLRYQSRAEFEGAELLYGRGAFAMTILVPPEGVAPADLIEDIDAATWHDWMDGFEGDGRGIHVELPRFRLEWEKSLNDVLMSMGMQRAFSGGADLSRLFEGALDLAISDVRQKTFVDVNEEGTEAAAATSVGVVVTSAPPTFRVRRPFLFAIRERFSGTILFIGQVLDPTAQ